jgi:hypothetical protein
MPRVFMVYSKEIGLWKTARNFVIFFAPSVVAFLLALPEDVQLKYAPVIGAVIYFLNNYRKHKDMG